MNTSSGRRALIIAADQYEDPSFSQLKAPAHDAVALAQVLGDPRIGGFDVLPPLLNQPAHVLTETIEGFFQEAERDDLLLLHISCHGVKTPAGQLYFATTTTKLNRLRATGVAASFVAHALGDSLSRHCVLLLDCCYSGAFDPGLTHRAGGGVDLQGDFRQPLSGRGKVVITASTAMEYAFEGSSLTDDESTEPSIFTNAVVQGLRTGEADRNEDGWVDLDELYGYTFDAVRRATPRQTPNKWTYGLQGEMRLARSTATASGTSMLPKDVQQAIENGLPLVRASIVPELVRLASEGETAVAHAARHGLLRLANDGNFMVANPAVAGLAEIRPLAEGHALLLTALATPQRRVAVALRHPLTRMTGLLREVLDRQVPN